jgi:hypothetical protein
MGIAKAKKTEAIISADLLERFRMTFHPREFERPRKKRQHMGDILPFQPVNPGCEVPTD